MMKVILAGVAGLVVGLGGSTGAMVMLHKPAPAKAEAPKREAPDSAHADSTGHPDAGHGAAPADSAHAAADSTHEAPAAAAPHAAVAPVPAPAVAPVSPAPAPTPAPRQPAVRDVSGYKQLAKIVANMKPADAVAVMSRFTDDEVEGILRQVNVRQAAQLMSAMPKERAAELGRRLLAPQGKP